MALVAIVLDGIVLVLAATIAELVPDALVAAWDVAMVRAAYRAATCTAAKLLLDVWTIRRIRIMI